MKLRVYAIGKPKLPFAARGVDEYAGRLARAGDIGIEYLKPRDARGATALSWMSGAGFSAPPGWSMQSGISRGAATSRR
jgi:hypothetical protein